MLAASVGHRYVHLKLPFAAILEDELNPRLITSRLQTHMPKQFPTALTGLAIPRIGTLLLCLLTYHAEIAALDVCNLLLGPVGRNGKAVDIFSLDLPRP